ncbi:RidA family protein [Bosea sp. 2YAB26]|uniref:RidA family protein n=1 Tax=Bosea sp. 2YAB26 TaxID=3237478 RepID=UPI003F8F9332
MREAITLPGQHAKYYSDIVKAKGALVFLAGQVGWDEKGTWAPDFASQLELSLENMKTALHAAGATIDDVVKVNAYLVDVRYGDEFNEVYARYFKTDRPVRTRVQAAMLARDCLVEIDVIAVIDDA